MRLICPVGERDQFDVFDRQTRYNVGWDSWFETEHFVGL